MIQAKTQKETRGTIPETLYIIDASIFIFRYYFSMPAFCQANNGRPTETVYGYTQWLLNFLESETPTQVVACFDESLGTCFRNELYSNYKISRPPPDDDLRFQLLACKKITQMLGVSCFVSDRYEADDLIGCFAQFAHKKSKPYAILSRDKDLGQLLYDSDAVIWEYPEKAPLNADSICKKFGVMPAQFADYLALVGDPGDDIPGVPGVGAKTAAALLQHLGSWENIKANLTAIAFLPIRGASKLADKLETFAEQIELAKRLTTIRVDAIKVKSADLARQQSDWQSLESFFEQLGFPSSIQRKLKKYHK